MARHIDVTLDGLHQLLHRLERKELADGDWAVCSALVLQLITRLQGKQERMAAKLAAAGAANGTAGGAVIEGQLATSGATPTLPAGGGPPPEGDGGTSTPPPEPDKKKAKGHGRNVANAFINATHFAHGLAAGVLGSLCPARGIGRLSRYRKKVIIRVVGQPLFPPELHHSEQARCRNCGRIERAAVPAHLREGLGTEYIVYDWSAYAMLVTMHYFAASPFKRLEALHEGWGIPLADANLWRIVDETADVLHPLYRTLELHGIQSATSLRIDDTGSMVVALAWRLRPAGAAPLTP